MRPIKLVLALNFLLIVFSCSKDENTESTEGTTTDPRPKTITNEVTDISIYTLKISGKLTHTGATPITEVGFVVSDISNPTLTHNLSRVAAQMDADGNFSMIYQSLPSNTTLYFRSYAKNSNGVGYGNEVTCITMTQNICTDVNTYLYTQQQVDEFGANHYTTISGNLYIQGDTITNLAPLAGLVLVYGQLEIQYTNVSNLNGLESLKYVGGLRITNNSVLLSCTGLNNMEKVNGDFYINNNDNLINLEGLNSLQFISSGGDLRIGENDNLETLTGLHSLIGISDDLIIVYNPMLTTVSALSNLEIVNFAIHFNSNPLLQNLNGLGKITKANRLEIINNQSLTNLNGLNNLEKIGWTATIKDNSSLVNLNGLEKLVSIAATGETSSYLTVSNNTNLVDLSGLQNLNILGGINRNLTINNNSNLSGFCPLKNLFTNNPNFYNLNISNNLTNPGVADVLTTCP